MLDMGAIQRNTATSLGERHVRAPPFELTFIQPKGHNPWLSTQPAAWLDSAGSMWEFGWRPLPDREKSVLEPPLISRSGKPALTIEPEFMHFPDRETMMTDTVPSHADLRAAAFAQRAGALIRARRRALGLRLDDIAAATGIGRRFIHELETGKASCQLGRTLVVAAAVGLHPFDMAAETGADDLPPPL